MHKFCHQKYYHHRLKLGKHIEKMAPRDAADIEAWPWMQPHHLGRTPIQFGSIGRHRSAGRDEK